MSENCERAELGFIIIRVCCRERKQNERERERERERDREREREGGRERERDSKASRLFGEIADEIMCSISHISSGAEARFCRHYNNDY